MSNFVTNYYKNKVILNIFCILCKFFRDALDNKDIFPYNSRPQTMRRLERDDEFEFEIIEN
jgi:hypothetical protein